MTRTATLTTSSPTGLPRAARMSTTKTSVWSANWPSVPVNPASGGRTSITWEPTVCSTMPSSQPVGRDPTPIGKDAGSLPSTQVESNTLPVDQLTPTYWTVTIWPASTCGPSPRRIGWDTASVGGAVSGGIVTVGRPSGAQLTVGSPSRD